MFMSKSNSPAQTETPRQSEYVSKVAPAALALEQDHILFPGGALLPLTARAVGVPGMNERPWARMSYSVFYGDSPAIYSISLRREPPDTMRSALRARRTLSEVFLMALATKTGRRPSTAEAMQDSAMDQAESALALGKPAYKA